MSLSQSSTNGAMPSRHPEPTAVVARGWFCLAALVTLAALGCDSKLVLGTWTCPLPDSSAAGAGNSASVGGGAATDSSVSGATTDVPVEWSTSFEDGFCDFIAAGGSCYSHPADSPNASYDLVDTQAPVHSGRYAAAFRVKPGRDIHTRCYLQGRFPKQATYGAWYYIPAVAKTSGNWNLLHFERRRRSNSAGPLDNLWDISLENDDTGGLRLRVWAPDTMGAVQGQLPSIPIGEWFHIEVTLRFAADATGEVGVFLNGKRYAGASGIVTDYADSEWGKWFVGNLAEALDPPQSIVYVDDVSIKPAP